MTAATGWRALYAPETAPNTFDLTWTTKLDVLAWADANVGSPDTVDGLALVGWVMDVDGSPAGRGVLRPAHKTSVTGTDGREQVFVMYLPA